MRKRWRGFELPSKWTVDPDTRTDRFARFTVEPFERGFGTTLGNSMRRVLLSSLEGAAVTSVKFANVLHEFSTIDGVLEDVADIVLNVKQLRVRVRGDEGGILRFDVTRKGPVRGGDIEPVGNLEVVNKDLVIATLTDKGRFAGELEVQKGRGYRTAEENEREDQEIGRIPVDSVFSPVLRVEYHVEDARVGKLTNYDRLITSITTDGTITPEMAVVEAAKILRKHINVFVHFQDLGTELPEPAPQITAEALPGQGDGKYAAQLDRPIGDLRLSVRASNCLESENIRTIADLIGKTRDELLAVRNFGKTSLEEVEEKLAEMALDLKPDTEEEE